VSRMATTVAPTPPATPRASSLADAALPGVEDALWRLALACGCESNGATHAFAREAAHLVVYGRPSEWAAPRMR
jgi:hypothetical protein